VFSVLIFLSVGGAVAAGLIEICRKTIKSESKERTWNVVWKTWFGSFLVLTAYLVFFNLINLSLFLFTRIMIALSPSFVLSTGVFRFFGLLIAFVWVAGIIIFTSFAAFYIVIERESFFRGMMYSARLVKKEYLETLCLSVIFFVVVALIEQIGGTASEVLNYFLVLPYLFLIMTRFVLEFGNDLRTA